MKKVVIVFTFLFVALFISFAQDCSMYFPVEEGKQIELTQYNAKDKVQGTIKQKILKFEEKESETIIIVLNESYDKNGKEIGSGEFEMRCKEGVFYMDMKNYLDEKSMEAYDNMEVEITASDLAFPKDIKPGDQLKDASLNIKISGDEMINMGMDVFITDRKVEGTESITTPAGTFDCFRISYKINTKTFIMKIQMSGIEWIAEDIGVVRSESYNKKGKLIGYSLLSALN
ncbi:MAG: DUF3108 domain-containing protein [Bacteroidales bacterium]|nr:DUF3108 domain-containing protein [Bacteroidales bacterium]